MTDEQTDLKAELLKLASAIVKEANAQGAEGMPFVPFADKVDAVDKLTRLYIAFRKHPNEGEEDTDEFNFDQGIKASPQGQPNGTAAGPRVHGRRRPATGSSPRN